MDLKTIKQVVDLMKRSDLTRFEIEEKDLKLSIAREGREQPTIVAAPLPHAAPAMPAPMAVAQPAAAPAPAEAPKEDTSGLEVITSPIVGTFYQSPSPDAPHFVQVGSDVNPSTTVCIIEAMKVMNEIHAEMSGVVTEILVKNGQSVEFGQPLFKVRPN